MATGRGRQSTPTSTHMSSSTLSFGIRNRLSNRRVVNESSQPQPRLCECANLLRRRLENPPSAQTRWAISPRRKTSWIRAERLERAVGFEPTQCQVGSLVPFRLATPAQRWSREWDLNPRSRDYRSRALPTELSLDKEIWCRVQESNPRSLLVRQAFYR
jgi:hypothetical protein